MDILFEKFNICKVKDTETYENKFNKIFLLDTDILSIYSYIRSENISLDNNKINFLRNKTKEYIQLKLKTINSVNTFSTVLNDINNKLLRIKLLFDYIANRKNSNQHIDLFIDFIKDFYTVSLENISIFIEYNFKYLIDQKTHNSLHEIAINSFKLFIDFLNYPLKSKSIVTEYINFYHNCVNKLVSHFIETIKLFLTCNKTLLYSDLVNDFKLIESCIKYEQFMINTTWNNLNKIQIKSIINSLPVLQLVQNINIYTVDQTYYDIIKCSLENSNNNLDINNYIIKLINNLEMNVIITKQKYASESLLLEIAKIFKIYYKMMKNWSFDNVAINIKKSINNILNYDEILINYIATSLIIFVKKISSENLITFKELATSICANIAISNKQSHFLDILYQNLQNNSLKNKITPEFFEYINNIINLFDSTETNYMKIKKFLIEIETNIDYNTEISKTQITCNKKIPFDMSISNTILLNKEIWKNCVKNTPKFKIPEEINIYFKIYEQFYNVKHNYRSIEWSNEHSFIDIDINGYTITGAVLPISILFLIANHTDLTLTKLNTLLEITDTTIIDTNIDLLVSNNIIKFYNDAYILSDIKTNINLNKLTATKHKTKSVIEHGFDINNSTDCYIIKVLKPLNGSGLDVDAILKEVNQKNIYFQVTKEYIASKLEILIKKSYIAKKDELYYYDV